MFVNANMKRQGIYLDCKSQKLIVIHIGHFSIKPINGISGHLHSN